MMKQVLVLDIGNSRIKWGLAGSSGWIDSDAGSNNEIESLFSQWRHLNNPWKIVGSNVASTKVADKVESYWHERGIGLKWIQPSEAACGVTNRYERPELLGTDRWAALIGAWHRTERSCLVVAAGTAMTIDMLNDKGEFMGGQILPGRKLMLGSLVSGTHALQDHPGQVRTLPRNTADAMATGIANALVSSIENVYRQMRASSGDSPACLITGGDAKWLHEHLNIDARIEPMLVLDGLLRIAEEEESGL
jgi:type III pantothenate kinase